MAINLDQRVFNDRIRHFTDQLNDSQSLVIVAGVQNEDLIYLKSVCAQNYLLGFEFPETLMAITKSKVTFVSSSKKLGILSTLKGGIEIELVEKENADFGFLKQVLVLKKDLTQITGKVVTAFQEHTKDMDLADATDIVGFAMANKDDAEVEIMKEAADLTSKIFSFYTNYVVGIIDSGKKVVHSKLSESLEQLILDDRKRGRLRASENIDWKLVEWCYPPIIQSGGEYDLKPSAQSDENKIHAGTILTSFGIRYKSYCSNLSRTILINPEKQKETDYKFLLELHKHVLGFIKPGVACNDIYSAAVKYVAEKRPDLSSNLVKNIGFGIGIEFRDSTFLLNSKNTRKLVAGMALNLNLGFQGIEVPEAKDPKAKVYALSVGDLVIVKDDQVDILTDADTSLEVISYTFGEEEDDETKVQGRTARRGAVIENQLRGNEDRAEMETRRRDHQKQLMDKLQEEGLAKYSNRTESEAATRKAVFKKFECYRKDVPLPRVVANLQIHVDRRAEAVILPIFGQAVPFHISTLKNVSKSDEGDQMLVRFNFITPGQATGKKEEHAFEDPSKTFVRSFSYRSPDIGRMSDICKTVTDIKKEIQKREQERVTKAGLVEQDDLEVIKGRRPPRIPDVFIRPNMEGKRYAGDLEIHVNGLRYQSSVRSEQKIDILFSNIKHFFFQPCDGELIILLHVQLNDAIMIGKKKTNYVQFYREVTDASFDETGNRRRRANYGDEDELRQEQEERRHRQMLNREFQQFAEKISDGSRKLVDVDTPMRDLGFQGVPHRQLVTLYPTTEALVHLSDNPPLVVTLADVEIAHLERVQFGLKNFDLVLIFKDLSIPVVHINTIPSNQLENVKDWLDSVDIPFTEGPVNLSWPQIMKTIQDDPKSFFEEAGGWTFLVTDGDSQGSDAEESGSEFNESEMGSGSEDFSASDDDSDVVEESDDDSGSGSAEMSGSESGADWDDLEREAAAHDQKKRSREEEAERSTTKIRRK